MYRVLYILFLSVMLFPSAAQPPQPARLAPRETAEGVLFQCYAPEARKVFLAGSFNRWAGNVGGRVTNDQYAMRGPNADGLFQSVVPLPPGVYRYKFALVDGTEESTWFAPEYSLRRDEQGNALFVVDGQLDREEDLVFARPPQIGPEGVTFEYFAPDAAIVFLAGDFNRWANRSGGRVHDLRFAMRGPDPNGIWRIAAALPPGRHLYQFVIDGDTWIADPLAAATTTEGHSLLEIR